jgi:signal transduction histidine kinase
MTDGFYQDIAAVHSIEAIPTILDIVCRTTGMRFAAVARVTEDRWIACSIHDEIAFGLEPGGELDIKSTICNEVRQDEQAVIIDNVAADPVYSTHHTPALYGFQSYVSMPIRLTDGTFFGTLCAIDPAPHVLNTPEIVAMFRMFADVIGFHLSAVDRLRSVEAVVLDQRKASVLREQLNAVLAHDLRNPLASIGGGVDLLLSMTLPDQAMATIRKIQDNVSRMTGQIDNLTDFARSRLGGGRALTRDAAEPVEALLHQIVADWQANAPDRVIETLFALTDPVRCDRTRLAQLVSILLANALAYGEPGQPVQMAAITTGSWLKLSVTNVGDPIPPVALKNIFQPVRRAALGSNRQGLGLGLYIANEIAKAHHGRLVAVSTPVETRFTLLMPLA